MSSRTVLVNASYAPSLTIFRGPLIRAMVAAGHRVHASAPGLTGETARAVAALGAEPHDVPLSRAGLNPVDDLAYLRAVRALIRRTGADLVLGYTIKPCIFGSLAARSCGVESASLVTGLGFAFIPGKGAVRRLVGLASRQLWRRATAANRVVIFQNPDDRDDFIAAGALADAGKARLVNGSGVDMAHYAPAPLPGDARFLMIARLLGNKGVREYAEAACRLIAAGSRARFALGGFFDEGPDGIDPAELAAWRAAGLDYMGPLDDVRPALAACSVYVLPSYREGTPRTVLEAMATGRAVITTDAPGCRETVRSGDTGLLVPVHDVAATAAAMKALSEDGAARARMGRAGRDLCEEKYAVEKVNAAMLGHLRLA
ncbi:glycosyltransferase family 4 protein [Parablastomonas sp. CN1-191]|uniref:glycosyltransferase family 4 protein n=1 Tax=Parablastomonas sp. CN1-191 TaxID=3400908 RepID=UPI003BF89913